MEKILGQAFDHVRELKEQCRDIGKHVEGEIDWDSLDETDYSKYMPSVDWAEVKEGDPLVLSNQFDLLEWWASIGYKDYTDAFLVAATMLSLHANNAFLERTFSTCTWFDDPLH